MLRFISALDMVSYENEFVRSIPADRLVTTELLVAMFWDDTHYAVLYHGTVGKEKRTFMKGQWADLGLGEYQLFLSLIVA